MPLTDLPPLPSFTVILRTEERTVFEASLVLEAPSAAALRETLAAHDSLWDAVEALAPGTEIHEAIDETPLVIDTNTPWHDPNQLTMPFLQEPTA